MHISGDVDAGVADAADDGIVGSFSAAHWGWLGDAADCSRTKTYDPADVTEQHPGKDHVVEQPPVYPGRSTVEQAVDVARCLRACVPDTRKEA